MKVIRKGLFIEPDSQLIPGEGSANVEIELEGDGTFSGYAIEPHVGYMVKGVPKDIIAEISGTIITIPRSAFNQPGPLLLNLKLIKSEEELVTNTVKWQIFPGPNPSVKQEDIGWQTMVDLAAQYVGAETIDRITSLENAQRNMQDQLTSIINGNTSVIVSVD